MAASSSSATSLSSSNSSNASSSDSSPCRHCHRRCRRGNKYRGRDELKDRSISAPFLPTAPLYLYLMMIIDWYSYYWLPIIRLLVMSD